MGLEAVTAAEGGATNFADEGADVVMALEVVGKVPVGLERFIAVFETALVRLFPGVDPQVCF
jgi:hypothetical protein